MENANQEVPPVPGQSPVKAANNLNFLKIIAYGFVIVSIGISIAVGGYLLGTNNSKPQPTAQISAMPTPTPDPTANWQTYSNANFGVEFKHPLEWGVAQTLDARILTLAVGPQEGIDFLKKANFQVGGGVVPISILKYNSTDIPSSDSSKTVTSRAISVGGVNGIEYSTTWKVDLPGVAAGDVTISAHIKNAETTYVVSLYKISYREIFDQILSTLKFTDQVAQITPTFDPAASWKTFAGNGYSIKYPENFGANVWRAFTWPPTTTRVSATEDPVQKGCSNFPSGNPNLIQKSVIVDNISYTLHEASDAAAGSSYNSYCYVTMRDQNYYVVDFVIKTTNGCGQNCSVYCGTPNETACRNFNLVKEVEKPIQDILSTFKFTN